MSRSHTLSATFSTKSSTAFATTLAAALVAAITLPFTAPAQAQTRTMLDQASAMAGRVTPGDAPGFPITISRAGSYRLMSDLVVPAGASGIVITAANVTLDLNGHSIKGPVVCSPADAMQAVSCSEASQFSSRAGISSVGAPFAVIRNGTVMGFAGLGVHYGEGALLENLDVMSNAGVGVAGMGYRSAGMLRGVRVQANGGPGIVCEHMRIERSSFVANGGTGIDCLRSAFSDTVSTDNGGHGVAQGEVQGVRTANNRLDGEATVTMDTAPADAASVF